MQAAHGPISKRQASSSKAQAIPDIAPLSWRSLAISPLSETVSFAQANLALPHTSISLKLKI